MNHSYISANCGEPGSVTNGKITFSGTRENSTAHVVCDATYVTYYDQDQYEATCLPLHALWFAILPCLRMYFVCRNIDLIVQLNEKHKQF